MIKKIHIENFRSIRHETLPLGKITVLTGANNSGKSSVLYGLMVLQDFVYNPNQSLENLFALPFINLGGFAEVKSKTNTPNAISGFIKLGITVEDDQTNGQTYYKLALGHARTFIDLKSYNRDFNIDVSLDIGLPYSANLERTYKVFKKGTQSSALFEWNGFHARINPDSIFSNEENDSIKNSVDSPVEALAKTDFIPVARSFTKPYYSIVPMTGIINTEEEVATMLKSDSHANTLGMVNNYLEEIADRVIELPTNGAPGLFSLKAKNTKTGISNFLVNEGSGTNQLVTILAKTFQYNKNFICIDEPEIHLHPSLVRKLANAFVKKVNDFGGQFLVSTHSEHFVQALLSKVAQKEISPDDVKIYHLTMTDSETKIEMQNINDKGQIEGGLSHFYEAELSDLKSIFKLVD